jgi:PAS domain S-box-containing protein
MKKVLVIEDNQNNRYIVRFLLEKSGIDTIEASTGEEGVAAAARHEPDLIIVDIQLPDINGLEVTRRIRARIKDRHHHPHCRFDILCHAGGPEKGIERGLLRVHGKAHHPGRVRRPNPGISLKQHGDKMMIVLIVDDNAANRSLLKALFGPQGYRVISAANGEKALDAVRREKIDLIISDILMPVMDGYRLCMEMKKDEEFKRIPFIFYTATYTDKEDEAFALSLGADRFILKPIDPEAFLQVIEEVMRQAQEGNIQPREPNINEKESLTSYSQRLAKKLDQKVRELQKELAARIEAEERLKKVNRYLKGIIENANVWFNVLDEHAKVTIWNSAAEQISGYPSKDVVGHGDIWEWLYPDREYRDEITAKVNAIIQKGEVVEDFETLIRRKDGETRVISWYSHNLTDEQGKPIGSVALGRDVTRRNKAESEVKEIARRYRQLFDANADALYVLDKDGRFLDANAAAEHRYQYSREDLLEMTARDLAATDLKDRTADRVRQAMLDGTPFEWRHQKRDGTEFPVEIAPSLMDLGNGQKAILSAVRDITERKRAEEERERLMSAINQAGESIIITDSQGTIQYVNPFFETVTGYTKTEIIGRNPRILKSGKQDQAFYQNLWQTISSGKSWSGRIINKRKNGSLLTEAATISPVRDALGDIINYVAVKRDITEHLQLESQFQQAQKMESVGRLAGGVAHDYNNILSVIIGYTELALEKVRPEDPLRDDLIEIYTAAGRSRDITRQLLAFARKETIAPEVLDLNVTIESTLKILRRLIGENIELAWLPGKEIRPVLMDTSQIDQILANLCINARDAIADVGRITIETGKVVFDSAYCVDHAGFLPGEFVMLSVSDDGFGMNRETQENIFEPFFTTKGVGKGTGLGLATVYGIVKQNNGFINVYSEPGQGTTFKIYLPHQTDDIAAERGNAVEKPLKGEGETVLVVEDEMPILTLIEKILTHLDYNVLTANTPFEALQTAETHAGKIALLITDVVMPEMNGRELAQQMMRLYPTIRCLFISGYTADVIANKGVLDKGFRFIQKPFSHRDLSAKVRAVLDQK